MVAILDKIKELPRLSQVQDFLQDVDTLNTFLDGKLKKLFEKNGETEYMADMTAMSIAGMITGYDPDFSCEDEESLNDRISNEKKLIPVLNQLQQEISDDMESALQGGTSDQDYDSLEKMQLFLTFVIDYCEDLERQKKEKFEAQLASTEFIKYWNKINSLTEDDLASCSLEKEPNTNIIECLKIFDCLESNGLSSSIGDATMLFWISEESKKLFQEEQSKDPNNKLIRDIDVPAFVYCFRKVKLELPESALLDPVQREKYERYIRFISAAFTLKARGNVKVIVRSDRPLREYSALAIGSVFWDIELPILRSLQRQGKVQDIVINYEKSIDGRLGRAQHTDQGEIQEVNLNNYDGPLVRKYPRIEEHSDYSGKSIFCLYRRRGIRGYDQNPYDLKYESELSNPRPSINTDRIKGVLKRWKECASRRPAC